MSSVVLSGGKVSSRSTHSALILGNSKAHAPLVNHSALSRLLGMGFSYREAKELILSEGK